MSDPQAIAVGRRVRALRAERGLTLSALARDAGIGKSSLSELEQGRRNPTLATLYALAGPLGVPLVALLGEEPGNTSSDGSLSGRVLHVEHGTDAITEVFWIELPPGGKRFSPPHAAGVREHVLVTHGALSITAGGTTRHLAVGQGFAWDADVEHTYTAGVRGSGRGQHDPHAALSVLGRYRRTRSSRWTTSRS